MSKAVGKPSVTAIAALVCLALAGASLVLPSAPTYDPYQWLIWGRDIAHLDLVTRGSGTSWKPLPALIAALLAPFGHAQAAGWLVVARAGGLFAVFMAFRLAARLAGPRFAWPAGIAAAVTLALTHDFYRRTAVGHAEGLTAAFVLLGIERHLDGRRAQAFALGVAAALIRPEAWLFVLAYGTWLWFARERPPRWQLVVGAALIPVLWFGGDWIGSGRLWTASDVALHPIAGSAGLTAHPALSVLQEAWNMLPRPTQLVLPIALIALLARRPRGRTERVGLALAGGALAWTAIVAVMAQRGYPGLPRFLFVADGLAAVLTGLGVARIAAVVSRPSARLRIAVATATVLAFAGLSISDASRLRADAQAIDTVADQNAGLEDAVANFGGAPGVFRCGHPFTGWWAVTALAYDLGVQPGVIEDAPHGPRPVVFVLSHGTSGLMSPLPRRHMRVVDQVDGWRVVDRCPGPTTNATRPARHASARAGSRSHARRTAHT